MAKEDEDEKTKEEVEAATEEAPAEEGMDEPNEEESPTARANREAEEAGKQELKERITEQLLSATSGSGTGMTDAGGVGALLQQLASKIEKERASAVELAKQKPGAPDLADLVVALLPAAIGAAVGDSRTALAGAVGGMTGLSERRTKQSEAISEEIKAKEKYAQTLEGQMISLQGRIAAALAGKDTRMPAKVLEQASGHLGTAIAAQRLVDFINTYFPDDESLADWAKRGKDKFLSTNANNAKILDQMIADLELIGQSGIKGIPSDKDLAKLRKAILGDSVVLTTQTLRKAFETVRDNQRAAANNTVKTYARVAEGGTFDMDFIMKSAREIPIVGVGEQSASMRAGSTIDTRNLATDLFDKKTPGSFVHYPEIRKFGVIDPEGNEFQIPATPDNIKEYNAYLRNPTQAAAEMTKKLKAFKSQATQVQ